MIHEACDGGVTQQGVRARTCCAGKNGEKPDEAFLSPIKRQTNKKLDQESTTFLSKSGSGKINFLLKRKLKGTDQGKKNKCEGMG